MAFIMSASQQHGLEIERLIKEQFQSRNKNLLPTSMPLEQAHTARFDVPGYVDPYKKGIPTSIKTAKIRNGSALVCMADANRISDLINFKETRLLVLLYQQKGDYKIFNEVREYIVTGDEWESLMGGVPLDVINSFSKAIKVPEKEEAKKIVKEWKEKLAELFPSTLIKWNAKIDSHGQRRLQCSINLTDIEEIIADKKRIRVFGAPKDPKGFIRPDYLRSVSFHLWNDGMRFPFPLKSEVRKRKVKNPEVEELKQTKKKNLPSFKGKLSR